MLRSSLLFCLAYSFLVFANHSECYTQSTENSSITYFVAVSGSDRNDGLSRYSAWRTLQHAAEKMQAGDTAIVQRGDYDESPILVRSGAPARLITFRAEPLEGARIRGFAIKANFIAVVGFEITNHLTSEPGFYGIYLDGSNNSISQNYIHDLCAEGIKMAGANEGTDPIRVHHNRIVKNRLVHCEMAGIHVDGSDNLVEGNEISHTAQYPAGCPSRTGADADGIRFFGLQQILRANYIHDIPWATVENPNPHTDCFQTWGPAKNITIEQNFCAWPTTSTNTNNEVSDLASKDGQSTDITYKNNLLVNMRQGINVYGSGPVKLYNNTFVRILQEALILQDSPNCEIINNIFYDVGSGSDSFVCMNSASRNGLVISTNNHFMPSRRAPGTYCSNAEHLTVDPLFVNSTKFDFRLRPGSPMVGAGIVLPSVTTDYFGHPRPQSKPYDLGAIQFSTD